MALVNNCMFRASSGGTGTWTVSSAITGYLTPADAGAVNATVYSYKAQSDDLSEWEVGTGTYTSAGTTLSRTPSLSTNSNNAVNFSAAPKVALVALVADIQPKDATLDALAAYNTNGLLTQTAADTFTGRTIAGTTNQITLTNGNGVSGNPTISLDASDIIVPAIITVPNTGLHILDTNASHDLIIAPGSNITADRTLTLTTGDANRTLDISAGSVTISAFGATLTDDADAATARSTIGLGNVANSAQLIQGKHTVPIMASAMWPRATSGAGEGIYDSGSNDVTIRTLDFDTTTQEYAHFALMMPKSWNESTVTAIFYWTNTAGASTQTVRWSLAGRALSDDDAANGAFGTAVTVDDTWLAQNDIHISSETSAITIGNTPAENDLVVFEVTRVVASDNMAGDANLIGIKLFLTYNAGDDT